MSIIQQTVYDYVKGQIKAGSRFKIDRLKNGQLLLVQFYPDDAIYSLGKRENLIKELIFLIDPSEISVPMPERDGVYSVDEMKKFLRNSIFLSRVGETGNAVVKLWQKETGDMEIGHIETFSETDRHKGLMRLMLSDAEKHSVTRGCTKFTGMCCPIHNSKQAKFDVADIPSEHKEIIKNLLCGNSSILVTPEKISLMATYLKLGFTLTADGNLIRLNKDIGKVEIKDDEKLFFDEKLNKLDDGNLYLC